MIKVKVTGIDQVRAELRNTASTVRASAREAMKRAALRIRDEARINAPRDKWNLEEAIQIVRSVGDNGRLQLDIDIIPVIHGVNVAQYALIIHENYNSIIVEDGDPSRRQGTKEKQAQYPDHVIGEKFLERAADKESKTMAKYMIDVVTRATKG